MRECDAETLVEIRDILNAMHDRRVGKSERGMSLMEMAALRDSSERINRILSANPPKRTKP